MVFRNFRINITLRLIVITLLIIFLSYLIVNSDMIMLIIVNGITILLAILNLFSFIDRTNRDLSRFLDSIKHDDFTQTFSIRGLGSSFNQLYNSFNSVMNDFRKIRREKEEQYNFLQIIIQHIAVGLISYKENGDIDMINNAAKRLLKLNRLRNISDLKELSQELADKLKTIRTGEKALIKINDPGKSLQLSIYSTQFVLRDQKYCLVSIQNIQSELEEKEMEAWQNLIRVLTHEIMNSATPITSLASTVNEMLDKRLGTDANLDQETLSDICSALQTIQKRSDGLIHFVENFRKITRVPRPNYRRFKIRELFDQIEILLKSKFIEHNISFTSIIEPETLELNADPELLEQVLINLTLNSIQAFQNQEKRIIELKAGIGFSGNAIIEIIDNGPGILQEIHDKIFIPFFTTKKDGSGIGLSLSRQIMKLHNGNIRVSSKPNEETRFTLSF